MAMRLDADIRELAEAAQRRRNEAANRVKRGEIQHLNFMPTVQLLERAQQNLAQLDPLRGDASLDALADSANYGLAVIAAVKTDAE